jgi:hypothetical protein
MSLGLLEQQRHYRTENDHPNSVGALFQDPLLLDLRIKSGIKSAWLMWHRKRKQEPQDEQQRNRYRAPLSSAQPHPEILQSAPPE